MCKEISVVARVSVCAGGRVILGKMAKRSSEEFQDSFFFCLTSWPCNLAPIVGDTSLYGAESLPSSGQEIVIVGLFVGRGFADIVSGGVTIHS